jgi:hypothetical protein
LTTNGGTRESIHIMKVWKMSRSYDWPKGDSAMFEQVDDPNLAIKKTGKEWLLEGLLIVAIVAIVLGGFIYALH